MSIRTPIPAAVTGSGVSQDNIIFAMIVFSFVVYITLKGEFTTYLNFFAPAKSSSATSASTAGANNASTGYGPISTITGTLKNIQSLFNGGGKVNQ